MATEIKKVYSLDIQGVESVNDLKKAIEQLNDRLKTLNDTSKEYKDTLIELTSYQDKLAEAMRGVTEATSGMSEMSEFLDDFTQGFVEGVNEAIESTDLFDESILREATSVKELREQIKTLQDALVKLDSGSADYKRTVELLTEKNQKLQEVMAATKTQVTAAAGSYNALTQELSALRKQWKATSDEAERARIGERMGEINKQLKELDASIGNYQRNVGNYANSMREVFTDPRKEIRELRIELAQLEEGSEEYNRVLMRMAELTTEQRKLTEQLKYSSSDLGDILGNLGGVASGVVGGFSALNALMGLMGNQSSDLQKAMLKTQQLMALVQGLSAMEGLKDRIKGLVDGIKGFSSRFGVLNKDTKEFAENTKTVATETERATGSLDAQAGVVSRLAYEIEHLNQEEKGTTQVLADEITQYNAKIATLQAERAEMNYNLAVKQAEGKLTRENAQTYIDELNAKTEEIQKIREEIETKEKAIEKTIQESRERRKAAGELSEENLNRLNRIDTLEKDREQTIELIQERERELSIWKREKERYEQEKDLDEQRIVKKQEFIKLAQSKIDANEREIATLQKRLVEEDAEIAKERQLITIENERLSKIKQLEVERGKLHKVQVLSIAQNKLEIAETKNLILAQQAEAAGLKGLAAGYNLAAVASRVAAVAVKGFKAALISSGIGLIIVGIGSALSSIIDSLKGLWANITGVSALNAQLERMNKETEAIVTNLGFMRKLWDAFGYTDFKKQTKEIYNYKAAVESAEAAMNKAIKENSDMAEELEKKWAEVNEELGNTFTDARLMVDKLMNEVEKADRQKGMSQLEIDLEETNQKFADAIELVKLLGKEGKMSMEEVDEYVKRLNKDLELQRQMIIEKSTTATTATTATTPTVDKNKEEAERIYKELVENAKREEQKLKEKYEKEKKLLEKYHKDTKLLTEQYNKDMENLLISRMKVEYDKWVEHLNSILKLQENGSIEYMEMEIENLKKIFSADFGADIESPFEDLFDIQILDEVGSKAISITEDIAESMKMIGLDPTNIDDIQKMIDKWNLDKKAIEDAEKALKKYKSELKFTEYENEENAIDAYLDYRLQAIDTLSQEIASKSMTIFGKETGFYTGLSPQDLQNEFEARYAIMETEINKEIELWKSAMEDESLSAEDRNKAIQHYNQAMAKHNAMMVQKQIDGNNLLIKSYQNVSNSLASISNSLTSILGSVSDAIMNNAEAQLNAGKITEEAYEEQFYKAKAFQIAQATIQTIAGAVGAFMGITKDTGGWGIAAAAMEAAAVLAAGFAQIAQIRATQPNTGGGNSGGGGGGATTFTLPSVMIDEPTYQQNLTSQSDIDALANALDGRDQRVVLVESDVTLAQKHSKKVSVETTF